MIVAEGLSIAGSECQNSKKRKVVRDERYPANSRKISLFSTSIRHPLNVRPSGNAYMPVKNNDSGLSREAQMGYFSRFSDEMLMTFLSYINDPTTLKNLSHTSRVMYAYLYDEDIWKKMYIQSMKQGQDESKWYGSWRCNVLKLDFEKQANLTVPDNLLCSDTLYRPFQNSQIDYNRVFNKIIQEEKIYHEDSLNASMKVLPPGRIERISEESMTLDLFNSKYHNLPFILTNSDEKRWPKWNFQTLLKRFPHVKFRQEAVEWELSLYAKYLENNHDESPLYLFDCSSEAMKTLKNEYNAPEIFKHDLFTLFNLSDVGKNCRPDHAWLIVGPKRSGSTFHKDPNNTSAWNTALTGKKLWIMLPPKVTPPGVGTDEEESEVTSPAGIAEWVMSGFFNDCLKIEECLIGITFPGECMHVPAGWWHSVINIDDSVALTQNFLPEPKLPNVLDFFKNKRSQISGFRPNQVKEVLDHVISLDSLDEVDLVKFKEYRDKFNILGLSNDLGDEDCGEISQLPPMPVFELLQALLKQNGKEEELRDGLAKLKVIERKARELKEGRSEAWEKLTQQSSTTQFSFGFNLDESSDEES